MLSVGTLVTMTDPPSRVNINDSFTFKLPKSKLGQERQTGPGIGISSICISLSLCIGSHISGKITQIDRGLRSNIVGRPNGVAAGDACADCDDALYPTKAIESVTIRNTKTT